MRCIYSLGCVTFQWNLVNLPGATLLRKINCSSPRNHQLPRGPWLRMKFCAHLSSPYWGLVWLELSQPLWVQFTGTSVLLCLKDSVLVVTHCLGSYCPLFLLPQWSLGLGRRGSDLDLPFRAEYWSLSYSLLFGQLWSFEDSSSQRHLCTPAWVGRRGISFPILKQS